MPFSDDVPSRTQGGQPPSSFAGSGSTRREHINYQREDAPHTPESVIGPFLPLANGSRCCDRSPHSGHSLQAQNLRLPELAACGPSGLMVVKCRRRLELGLRNFEAVACGVAMYDVLVSRPSPTRYPLFRPRTEVYPTVFCSRIHLSRSDSRQSMTGTICLQHGASQRRRRSLAIVSFQILGPSGLHLNSFREDAAKFAGGMPVKPADILNLTQFSFGLHTPKRGFVPIRGRPNTLGDFPKRSGLLELTIEMEARYRPSPEPPPEGPSPELEPQPSGPTGCDGSDGTVTRRPGAAGCGDDLNCRHPSLQTCRFQIRRRFQN